MRSVRIRSLFRKKFAVITTYALSIVLFVCANTNSCCMVHQVKVPAGLEEFSKIQ